MPSPKIVINPPKNFCFVVMSFSGDPVIESYYEEAIKPTVKALGYDCIRADEEHYSDTISRRIRDNIEDCAVVIVDLTEDRPNCYFEAGYAVALNKSIIFQRLNAPPKYTAVFHFDVQDYPFILYHTVADLRKKLDDRLKALLGES
jgi:nucleoside 2-deoxyribosyltransferase